MNRESIIKELDYIHNLSISDYEAAHSCEDALYANFVQHVAAGKYGELSEMAKLILSSGGIDFPRYCA